MKIINDLTVGAAMILGTAGLTGGALLGEFWMIRHNVGNDTAFKVLDASSKGMKAIGVDRALDASSKGIDTTLDVLDNIAGIGKKKNQNIEKDQAGRARTSPIIIH